MTASPHSRFECRAIAYILLFLAALVAFAVSAVSGGGAGLILLPIIGLVLPLAHVPAALFIGTASSALSRSLVFRRHVRWDVVSWFVPAAIPATALGAWLLSRVQPLWIELLLGLFLVTNVVALFRRHRGGPGKMLPRPALLTIGAAAGFLSGFTGAVGVVFNQLYLRCGLTKEEVVVGTIVAPCSQPRRRRDLMSQMRDQATTLVDGVRYELEGEEGTLPEQSLQRAWIAYRLAEMEGDAFGARSLAWIALGEIFEAVREIEEDEGYL